MSSETLAVATANDPALNLDNIQGNILGGFNKDYQAFLFLKLTDPTKAKGFFRKVTCEVATASQVKAFGDLFKGLRNAHGGAELGMLKATWMNMAFSFSGLEKLGASDVGTFPPPFREGMAVRAGINHDTGESDPKTWVGPFNEAGAVDVVLMIAADDQSSLHQSAFRYIRMLYAAGGIDVAFVQEGAVRIEEPGHEHFGFKDGVSQPGIRGFTQSTGTDTTQGDPGQDLLHPGEFVLGYRKQAPLPDTKEPFELNTDDSGPIAASGPNWTKDGSYLVFRRLRQDVDGFRTAVATAANDLGVPEEVIGAKIVGRYASGCPMEITGNQLKDPAMGKDFCTTGGDPSEVHPEFLSDAQINNFEYVKRGDKPGDTDGDDTAGARVPRGAHIRKAYPRNETSLEPSEQPDTAPDGLNETTTQTHRLLRRGIPYGTSFRPSLGAMSHGGEHTANDLDDRGLLFLSYQTDLANQFEFVQNLWVHNPDFPDPGTGADPLIAQDQPGVFKFPASPVGKCPVRHQTPAGNPNLSRFVTMTGGEYFFQPSIAALTTLTAK